MVRSYSPYYDTSSSFFLGVIVNSQKKKLRIFVVMFHTTCPQCATCATQMAQSILEMMTASKRISRPTDLTGNFQAYLCSLCG